MTSTLKADVLTSKTTNGDLSISGDGSGVPDIEASFKVGSVAGVPMASIRTSSGTASSSTFLRGDGTWNAPAAGGGAWNIIGTAVASDSATVTVTGLNSTYDTFVIAISDMVPATDDANLDFRLGDASGIDTTSGDYRYHSGVVVDNSTSYAATSSTSDSVIRIGGGIGNATGEGMGAMLYLTQPGDATTFPKLIGHWTSISAEPRTRGGTVHGHRTAVITVDRVQVLMNTGNITSGRMTVWGIAHA